MTRRLLAAGMLVAALATGGWLAISAPGSEIRRAQACGPAGPYDFDTFESGDSVAEYAALIERAAYGRAVSAPFALDPLPVAAPPSIVVPTPIVIEMTETPTSTEDPSSTGTEEPTGTGTPEATDSAAQLSDDFTFQGLEVGGRGARTGANRAMVIPPVILKSIAWVEASWANADAKVPWGGVGPILRSFDCGYGLGQITSGMGNQDGTPSVRQALIGTHPAFNLAEGARILADKWNSAPEHRPVAGEGNPFALEDWYFAIWSYNGFAETNHPFNPYRDPLRGEVYHCWSDDAPNVSSGFGYGDYTYPERVYGCMRFPPDRFIDDVPFPLWDPVEFQMPQFRNAGVADAFALENYQACSSGNFAGGCTSMDYATTLPAVDYEDPEREDFEGAIVHYDPTVVDLSSPLLAQTGQPAINISGPTSVDVDVSFSGPTIIAANVLVENVGGGIGAYRIITSDSWLRVVNADEPWVGDQYRTLDGGVVLGADMSVVAETNPVVYSAGYDARLEIIVEPGNYPGGTRSATVVIEPLVGGSVPLTVTVYATRSDAPPPDGGAAGAGPPYHAIVPGAANDGN